MKKSRITALILAMVITVSCLVSGMSFAAFAEENEPAKPELISYNVAYGSYFYFQAAVSTASVGGEGKNVTVSVYADATSTDALASATAAYTTEKLPEFFGGSAYVANIPYAISFTAMATEFYIEAECDGVKSDRVKYSIVEYLLQRLYKDGVVEVEGDQRDLYLNTLAFGKSIDTLDAGKADLVSNYRYVTVNGGTANGARGILVKVGDTVVVAKAAGINVDKWSVMSYGADNKAVYTDMSVEDAVAGFVVTDNMVISAEEPTLEAGKYFDILGGYTFSEYATAAEYNNAKHAYGVSTKSTYFGDNSICSSHVYAQYDNTAPNAGSLRLFMNIVDDPTDAANKVWRFHKYKEDDTVNAVIVGKDMNTEGNTLVFETDFYMPAVPEAAEATLATKGDAQVYQFAFAKTLEAEDRTPLEGWKLDKTSGMWTTWMASIQQMTNSDGSYRYYVTAFRDTTRTPAYVTNLEAATIVPETWNTLTIELNGTAGYVYLNGVLCSVCTSLKNTTLTNYDSMFISTRGFVAGANAGQGLYLDNTYLGLITK